MVNKIWEKADTARVWLMKMPEAEKKKRIQSYSRIDKMITKLLKDKGIRITKSSSITSRGIFHVDGKSDGIKSKLEAVKRYVSSMSHVFSSSRNLFFEMNYDYEEFRRIYDEIGGRQNNFPLYLGSKAEFEIYKKKHDLLVFEDVNTGKPVGFMTRELVKKDSPSAREYKDDFDYDVCRDILYMDTFALDEEYKAKGLGRDISQITDAFYLKELGDKCDFLLVTGDINTVNSKKLSLDNHKDRGFEVVAEIVNDASCYKERYDKWINRIAENERHSAYAPLSPMTKSFLAEHQRG